MQVGVIGGVCLLACLLSVGHSGELGDAKQSEESDTSDQKEVERSIENDVRRLNNDVKSSKEALNDLKSDVNNTEDKSKSSTEVRNDSQNAGDSQTSRESSKNRSSSDPVLLFKPPALPEVINPQSSSYFMDQRFTVEQGLPDAPVTSSGGNNGPAINPYFNTIPYVHQGFVPGSSPSDSPPAPLSSSSKDAVGSQDPMLRSHTLLLKNTLDAKSYQEISTPIPQFDITTAKSVERTMAINTNKAFSKLPTLYANFAVETTTGPQGSRFSPLFSSEYAHRPASEFIDPVFQASNNMKAFSAASPQSYSYDSRISFDETRRELKGDDIQERNADESQYSENMNAYPYAGPDSSSKESEDLRSGAPSYPYQNPGSASAQAYASAQVQTVDDLSAHNQGMNPYSYGYPPRPASSGGSLASASAMAQVSANAAASAQAPTGAFDGAQSRVIWPHEYIFPNKMPGGENVIQCTRENELHHLWSQTIDCLVCICLNEYGLLQPVCASCSGCRKPAPPEPPPNMPEPIPPTIEPYVPLPIPDPFAPRPVPNLEPFTPSASAPSLVAEPEIELELTTPGPVPDVPVSCSPLPIGQLFKHPLNPCQLCMCKEARNALGRIEVRIECQDSSQCVVPPETSTLPPIPDKPVPVPLPLCDKFPPHVLFPHPKESCKQCKCSIAASDNGALEQHITCFPNTTDSRCVPKTELTTELSTPPNPPIPIPVEPYSGPVPEPAVEPIPDNFPPPPSPNAGTPKEPLPWPPITTTPAPPKPIVPKRGPLPGPSPHESCRPYPPNQPFQHPWDDCQICECSELKTIGMINVEISCYTKLSCCIESPEHVISAIAGKSISKASGGPNGEDGKAIAMVNEALSSTFKPPAYTPGFRPNQGYVQTLPLGQHNPAYKFSTGYQSSNTIGSQSPGETSFEYKPTYNSPGLTTNQGYGEANAIAQSSYPVPGSSQSGNPPKTYGSINSISTAPAEANADYNITPIGTNNPSPSYTPGISQNPAYPESSAVAQKPLTSPNYQVPGSYQSSVPAVGSVNNGGLSSETSDEYLPLTITYKPAPMYPQYPSVQGQTYGDTGAQYNRPVSSTYKPPSLYGPYNTEVSVNQAYADALAQYNELIATQKPPALYGQYPSGIPQTQPLTNAAYSNYITSTFKPPALYSPYSPEAYQNQAYAQVNAQANAKYPNLVTSTPRSIAPYGQYNPSVPQNQIYPSPSPVYTSSVAVTEKPVQPYNPYGSSLAQNQAYAGANAQGSVTSPGYYLPGSMGQHQPGKGMGSGTSADQSSAIAEAVASQDYTPYIQSGSQTGTNAVSNPSSGYPYPSNYYTGYLSPQSTYQAKTDKGFDGYKQNQVQYAGNYEFNGQADGISILSPQSSYYPYGLGYAQAKPGASMYSALYPKQSAYEISSLYHPGQYGATNTQNVAQAYAAAKMQSKSGEGYPEDSEDSK